MEPYADLSVDAGVPVHVIAHCPGNDYSLHEGSSGGGHGGSGGLGEQQSLTGVAHGSYLEPRDFGCNGGYSIFPHRGGRGGGRLELEISDWLTIDGDISARGGDWGSIQAGGGSGGSVFIHTRVVDGSGTVDASGGAGFAGNKISHGGGGGGGRVALYYAYNFYVGK